jgi:hypothetical protein
MEKTIVLTSVCDWVPLILTIRESLFLLRRFLCLSFVSFAVKGFWFPPLPEPALERSEGFLRVSKILFLVAACRAASSAFFSVFCGEVLTLTICYLPTAICYLVPNCHLRASGFKLITP